MLLSSQSKGEAAPVKHVGRSHECCANKGACPNLSRHAKEFSRVPGHRNWRIETADWIWLVSSTVL